MKILLIGEYSGVHTMLAEGLRALGHSVTVASNGDFWKDYPRDIDLSRGNRWAFLPKVAKALCRMRGYDVVQLINPMFMELKAERLFPIYRYLRRHNKRMVLAAVGDDYYYPFINTTLRPMRYSDYNLGQERRQTTFAQAAYDDWVETEKERLNRYIAADCDMIIAGAYEYWLPYRLTDDKSFTDKPLHEKLHYVPFPFKAADAVMPQPSERLRIFIGVNKRRNEFKGTDIMLRAALDIQRKYPGRVELRVAENVPYAQYQHMMDSSDVVLDQLYSYGPGMNGLLALSKGLVTLTGGEPEHYDLMGESDCRPIVSVQPSYDSVYTELERLVLHPEILPTLKAQSRQYVLRNYDYIKTARQYETLYRL